MEEKIKKAIMEHLMDYLDDSGFRLGYLSDMVVDITKLNPQKVMGYLLDVNEVLGDGNNNSIGIKNWLELK